MYGSSDWKPSKPVAFAWLLCMLMLGGEIVSGSHQNPMALVFYCFLPVALWMIANEQKRDAQAISGLKARIDQLEESRRSSTLPKAGYHAMQRTRDKARNDGSSKVASR